MELLDSSPGVPPVAKIIYDILSNFFHDLEAHRAIKEHLKSINESDPSYHLWSLFSNNCLMMAAVEWCKIFGSSNNNKTHYTKCIPPLEGIEQTVQEMKEFRDKYISHYDFYDKPIPFMDQAVEVIKRFDLAMDKKYNFHGQESTSDFIHYCHEDINRRMLSII